jgi:hypothetical protein
MNALNSLRSSVFLAASILLPEIRGATAIEGALEAVEGPTLVCRGGLCTAGRFLNGSGVTVDAAGNLQGVSVNSAVGASLEDLAATIPNPQVGVSTVEEIEAAGGTVTPAPTTRNPFHCILSGITPAKAESLFTPTVANPCL